MKPTTYYALLKQRKNGKLMLWDGPHLSRQDADLLLKQRAKKYPDDKFFIYKQDPEYMES